MTSNKAETWKHFCSDIGGEFIEGGIWRSEKVRGRVKAWTITLDTYTSGAGKDKITYTRMRAPFVSTDEFRFTIYHKSSFSELGKYWGLQEDIEVGYPDFDRDFIIKSNNQSQAQALFASLKIRQLIKSQPFSVNFGVREEDDTFGSGFLKGVDELYCEVEGIIEDVERLKSLYELFAETLNHLCKIGSATEDKPKVVL